MVRICGGLTFEPEREINYLNEGEVAPLKKIVLAARRDPRWLAWPLPSEGWRMPNAQDLRPAPASLVVSGSAAASSPAFCVCFESVSLGPKGQRDGGLPRFTGFHDPAGASPRLGGVSMQMESSLSMIKDNSETLQRFRDQQLKAATNDDTLFRPIPR